jgi:hypothetical protein
LSTNNSKDISTDYYSSLPLPPPPTYTISKEIEGITIEIAVVIGYLLKRFFVSFGRKVRDEGIPRAIVFSYWLTKQSVILIDKSVEVGTPKAIEAGRITKGILILGAENLKTKGVPFAIRIFLLIRRLSCRFYKKVRMVVQNKVNIVKQDMRAAEKIRNTDAATSQPSSDIILKEEEAISLNEKIANEIAKTGIPCKPISDIESRKIEKKHYYSYLFTMSPRIVTNRGYIKLEGDNTRNIDFIQIIQKN